MFKLNHTQGTYERVIQYIEDNIIYGTYIVGSKLPPDHHLSEILEVTPETVLEARKTLETLGILVQHSDGSCYISNQLHKSLLSTLSMMFVLEHLNYLQISQVRSALELKALELAIENNTDSYMKQLSYIVNTMTQSTSVKEAAKLDIKFHYTIALMSQNKFIIDLLQAISLLTNQLIHNVREKLLAESEQSALLKKAHQQILIGIGEGNFEKASSALKLHFEIVDGTLRKNQTDHIETTDLIQ